MGGTYAAARNLTRRHPEQGDIVVLPAELQERAVGLGRVPHDLHVEHVAVEVRRGGFVANPQNHVAHTGDA